MERRETSCRERGSAEKTNKGEENGRKKIIRKRGFMVIVKNEKFVVLRE